MRPESRRVLAALLALFVPAWAGGRQTLDDPLGPLQARLSADEVVDRPELCIGLVPSPVRATTLSVGFDGPGTYTLIVASEDFSPFLELHGGDEARITPVKFEQSASGLAMELLVRVDASCRASAQVYSLDGEIGDFELRLERGESEFSAQTPAEATAQLRSLLAEREAADGAQAHSTQRARLRLARNLLERASSESPDSLLTECELLLEPLLRDSSEAGPRLEAWVLAIDAATPSTPLDPARSTEAREFATQQFGADSAELACVLRALGAAELSAGHGTQARPLLERAHELLASALGPEHPLLARCAVDLAQCERGFGEATRARARLESALESLERIPFEFTTRIRARFLLADVLLVLGGAERSVRLAEEAVALAAQTVPAGHVLPVLARMTLAAALAATGRPKEALACSEDALSIETAARGSSPLAIEALANRARAHFLLRQYELAREDLERAAGLAEERWSGNSAKVLELWNDLAMCLRALGDDARAIELHEDVLRALEEELGEDHPETIEAAMRLAFTLAASDPERSRDLYQRALEARFRRLELERPAMSEQEILGELPHLRTALDHCLSRSLDRGVADATAVYREVLRWKGLAYRSTAAARARAFDSLDPEVRAAIEELRRGLALLTELHHAPGTSAPLEEHLEQVRDEIGRLERRILERSSEISADTPEPAAVIAALAPGECCVDLFVYQHTPAAGTGEVIVRGELRVLAFVLEPGEDLRLVPLGSLDVLSRTAALHVRACARQVADPGGTDSAESVARRLRELLFVPLGLEVGRVQRILVAPESSLAILPFESLPGEAPASFLVEDFEFVYVQDAQDVVQRAAREATATNSGGLLLVGGVDYGPAGGPGPNDRGSAVELLREAGSPFAPLPATLEEADRIAELFEHSGGAAKVVYLEGREANEAAVRRELEHARFAHFATHGFLSRESGRDDASAGAPDSGFFTPTDRPASLRPGLLSGLVLAGANERNASLDLDPEDTDGLLTAEELGWIDLRGCALVTLSACDSGLGGRYAGENLLGLRRALRMAGAHCVLASLWKVPDEATRELMTAFYRALWVEGLAAPAALRRAQCEVLERNRRTEGAPLPGRWAAFVVDGDAPLAERNGR